MRGITTTIQTTLNLSPDDWELYSDMPGASAAAIAINEAIQVAVNTGRNRRAAERAALKVMQKYADFGAVDSEPLRFLDIVLDEIYRADGPRR